MTRWIRSLAVLIVLLGCADSALAQNARITGTLKDQSGAVLPGATVTARNQETGLTRTAVTNQVGEYVLLGAATRRVRRGGRAPGLRL